MGELFFKDVDEIGNLYLDYIFYEFEYEPILFVCVDDNNKLYFCLCSDIRFGQRWIIMKADILLLNELIEEKVEIAKAFLGAKNLIVYTMNLDGKEESAVVDVNTIDRLDLPKEGTYLRCNKEDARLYLLGKGYKISSLIQKSEYEFSTFYNFVQKDKMMEMVLEKSSDVWCYGYVKKDINMKENSLTTEEGYIFTKYKDSNSLESTDMKTSNYMIPAA